MGLFLPGRACCRDAWTSLIGFLCGCIGIRFALASWDGRPNSRLRERVDLIFRWLIGQWQDCNATCGGGWQFRDVYCAERHNDSTGAVENRKVEDKYCWQSKRPVITSSPQQFSLHPAPSLSDRREKLLHPAMSGVGSGRMVALFRHLR